MSTSQSHRGLHEWTVPRGAAEWVDYRTYRARPAQSTTPATTEPHTPGRLEELEGEVARLREEIEALRAALVARPVIRTIQIFDLDSDEYRLATPLLVVLEEYSDHFLARFPEVEAVGAGQYEQEAITRLKADLVQLHRDLQAEPPDHLDEITRRWKRVLSDTICRQS